MIDRLEQKGLIRRAQLPDDRRRVGLELTPDGKAVYPKLRAASAAVQNRFLRGFTRSEVRQLELFLQRMLSNG
jgi:DNA-binding MarR family transcriptional regulator